MNLSGVEDTKKWDIASTKKGQLPRWLEFSTWGMVYHIATKPSNKAFGYSHPSFRSITAHIWCTCNKCCQDDLCCQIPWLPCKIAYPLDIIVGACLLASLCLQVILSYKGCFQHPLCAYSHSPDVLPSTTPQKVSLELLLCICVQPVMPLLTVLIVVNFWGSCKQQFVQSGLKN